jgi:hypothetical protein
MTNLTREEILKERKEWYSKTYVQFEMIKCLKNRELCFLSLKSEEKKKAVRYLIGWSLEYFKKHIDWFNFFESLINVYHSVAVLKDVPVFSYDLATRKKEPKYIEFDKNYANYVAGTDFFWDIDGKENFELCHQEAKELKKIFDEYFLPYYIINSSKKGFHFVIEAKYIPKMEIHKLLEILNEIVYNLVGIYDFKTIDKSVIDLKRVKKTPYGFSCDGCICVPLSDEMFENFKAENVEMKAVLQNIQIKNRGLLTRNESLSLEELKNNVSKFFREFS